MKWDKKSLKVLEERVRQRILKGLEHMNMMDEKRLNKKIYSPKLDGVTEKGGLSKQCLVERSMCFHSR